MLLNGIAYVAVVSKDVPKAAMVFEQLLGLKRNSVATSNNRAVPVFTVGEAAIALFEPGDPFIGGDTRTGIDHVAFNALKPEEAAARAQSAGLAVLRDPLPGMQGKLRFGLDPSSTVGVKTFLVQPLDINRSKGGIVERIDHIGIASADNRMARDIFCGKLGLPLESEQTDIETEIALESFTSDKYGVVYHTRKPRIAGGLRVAFITAGDCELEFLQNLDAKQDGVVNHGNAGTTQQDQGAITRYIASYGAGLHHVALKVPDINAVLSSLQGQGIQTIDQVGRPGSRRALIGFVHPRSLGGVLFHFVQR
jgi:catechol 2,3-dioxygenase-like lactoylglutathione lyase family enzyme